MQTQVQITFRGMDSSPAIEARIQELAARFERFEDRITSCHVTIQIPHQHQHHGQLVEVRLHIGVRGTEIVIDEGSSDPAHVDAYVALRDAFAAAERKLDARLSRRGGRQPARL